MSSQAAYGQSTPKRKSTGGVGSSLSGILNTLTFGWLEPTKEEDTEQLRITLDDELMIEC
jgi:hypothetical protein